MAPQKLTGKGIASSSGTLGQGDDSGLQPIPNVSFSLAQAQFISYFATRSIIDERNFASDELKDYEVS